MTCNRPKVAPEGRYTVKETAFHLGICRDSLTKYTNEGRIHRYTHQSGRYFYLGKDILAFFDKLDATGDVCPPRGRRPKSAI